MITSTVGFAGVTKIERVNESGYVVTAVTEQGTTITTRTGTPPPLGTRVRFEFSWGDP